MQFHKRRQYLVNKAVQWAAVAYVSAIVLAILGFHTWITYQHLSQGTIEPHKLPSMLVIDVCITIAVMAIFVIFVTIFGSHKIAGPLYRCEKSLKRLQGGDLTDVVRLRRGDLLVPFTEELNLALANLREIAAEDRSHVQEAVRLIQLARGGIKVAEVQTSLDRAMIALGKIGGKLKIETDLQRVRAEPDLDLLNKTMPMTVLSGEASYLGGRGGANKTMAISIKRDLGDANDKTMQVMPPPAPAPVPAMAPAAQRGGDATVAMQRPVLAPPPAPAPALPAPVGVDSGATMPLRRSDLDLTPPPGYPGTDSGATMPLRRSDLNLTPPPGKS